MRSFQYSSKSFHFSENPPSEDKLEAKLLSPLDRKASAAMELLPELLLRLTAAATWMATAAATVRLLFHWSM